MTKIAVVQPALALAEVDRNLARVEDLVRDAHREHAPEIIIVPEGCSSPNVYSRLLLNGPRPVDGAPFQLITRLARELGCIVGGGFLAVRGRHSYGTYVLAEPDGAVHLHDKDIPTAWEQNYYKGGDDDGVVESSTLGVKVGLMSGWEWARNRTSARVRDGGAQLVLGGMCWPSFPTNWPGPLRTLCRHEHEQWVRQAMELPGLVARRTGVAVAHAAHVGPITGETPLAPGLSWPTVMVGGSQITERDGTILASLSLEDGEGHVAADVQVAPATPLDATEDRLWIQDFSLLTNAAWYGMNAHGNLRYRLRHARKGFGWQAWPSGDLPDEIPAGGAAAGALATS
ncbi:carbon-nitrogen hydrolase family protein [Paraconexibacter antarcticus]|uniref:Carbon-nitrogen hydrolase family protein n=1 Tax=Paraconexibacter antarcticus TaxID=2949664 RepID=A0ABY5DQ01_9ACTN|nr:carbon-nitrogen hydrolase family protein [Paraconexibacter antarcticus]UTI62790.1 carbon-nitrogen hydrolase family protein [Paraconexibacter antarcticus]